jgi:DNA modification methylase
MLELNKIYNADCLEKMKEIDDKSIDMILTSPPYWDLRDYGVNGQLGQEKTFQEYITKLCDIFDEAKRILKDSGTCWVNLGDTYISKGVGRHAGYNDPKYKNGRVGRKIEMNALPQSIPEKYLAQIPSRFAIEMTNPNYILREDLTNEEKNYVLSELVKRNILNNI